MKFGDLYRGHRQAISFELFPPKSEQGMKALERRLPRLIALEPDFLTVTYGAMGASRGRTLEIAAHIRNDLDQEVAHHLTCVGSGREELDAIISEISGAGIENIVALRGDPPKGQSDFDPPPGGFRHACELVGHLSGRDFGIAVAGYPETHVEASSPELDLQYLKAKVDAGADIVITQLFYDNSHFFNFVERCRTVGIRTPIIPGLLPIMDVGQIERIATMCGSSLPPELAARLHSAANREEVIAIGVEHTVGQARELLEAGVPGLHFYVLNHYAHIAEVMGRIR